MCDIGTYRMGSNGPMAAISCPARIRASVSCRQVS
jgi:hypothetical protein